MILVRGITSGGTLAQLLPDMETAEQWIATMEQTSRLSIAWSVHRTDERTINGALARLTTTTKETTT